MIWILNQFSIIIWIFLKKKNVHIGLELRNKCLHRVRDPDLIRNWSEAKTNGQIFMKLVVLVGSGLWNKCSCFGEIWIRKIEIDPDVKPSRGQFPASGKGITSGKCFLTYDCWKPKFKLKLKLDQLHVCTVLKLIGLL